MPGEWRVVLTRRGVPRLAELLPGAAAYKARILAAYDALPEGSPERGELLPWERLYHRLGHLDKPRIAGSVRPRLPRESRTWQATTPRSSPA